MLASTCLAAWDRRIDIAATVGALAVVPILFLESSARNPSVLAAVGWANWTIWWLFVADACLKVATRGPRWLRTRDGVLGIAYTSLLTAGIATALARGDRSEQSQDLVARLDALAARLDGLEAGIARLGQGQGPPGGPDPGGAAG